MTWRKTLKLEKFVKISQSFGFNHIFLQYYGYSVIEHCFSIGIDDKNDVNYIDLWDIGIEYDSSCDAIVYYRVANKKSIKNIMEKKLKNILTDYRNYLNNCIKKGKEMKIQNKLKNIENDFK